MSSNLDVGPFSGGNIAVYQDVQSSGVAGTTISTSIIDQPLNTEVIGKAWASLSANQITLDAGDYSIRVVDTLYSGGSGVGFLFITDSANTILESSEKTVVNGGGREYTEWISVISLSVSTAIKYRAIGVGVAFSRVAHSQGSEHYQKLIIQKIG